MDNKVNVETSDVIHQSVKLTQLILTLRNYTVGRVEYRDMLKLTDLDIIMPEGVSQKVIAVRLDRGLMSRHCQTIRPGKPNRRSRFPGILYKSGKTIDDGFDMTLIIETHFSPGLGTIHVAVKDVLIDTLTLPVGLLKNCVASGYMLDGTRTNSKRRAAGVVATPVA